MYLMKQRKGYINVEAIERITSKSSPKSASYVVEVLTRGGHVFLLEGEEAHGMMETFELLLAAQPPKPFDVPPSEQIKGTFED